MASGREAHIAANRFGLGAKPGEIAAVGADARSWLLQQLQDPSAFAIPAAGLPSRSEAALTLRAFQERRRAAATAEAGELAPENPAKRRAVVDLLQREAAARMERALSTPAPFAERLVWFWANHFTVSATKITTLPYVGLFEREAVRARLSGSFADLLLAATRHPGMLLYLDQAQSVGPNSQAGQRRQVGLNENLAREILELHTLGARGGYTQADVTEFARALTGWTVANARLQRLAPQAEPGSFTFVPLLHEPGARTMLGKRYAEGGEEQARAILRDLAHHPATGRRIAEKLARHFVADKPPAAAVAQLERVFRQTEGDLPSLHRAVAELDEAWAPEPVKFKSPHEFLVSSLRLAGTAGSDLRAFTAGLDLLGEPLYRAPSPAGWPDDAASWTSPDALMKRLEWAQAFAQRIGARARPEDLGAAALGPLLTPRSREAVRRAASAAQGLSLLLLSPEFQRR